MSRASENVATFSCQLLIQMSNLQPMKIALTQSAKVSASRPTRRPVNDDPKSPTHLSGTVARARPLPGGAANRPIKALFELGQSLFEWIKSKELGLSKKKKSFFPSFARISPRIMFLFFARMAQRLPFQFSHLSTVGQKAGKKGAH